MTGGYGAPLTGGYEPGPGGYPAYPADAAATNPYPAGSHTAAGPQPGVPPVAHLGDARSVDVGEFSVSDLIGNVTRDLSTLMRQELAIAQAEVKQEVSKTAKGAGALSGRVSRATSFCCSCRSPSGPGCPTS
jgi:hypothetical protein